MSRRTRRHTLAWICTACLAQAEEPQEELQRAASALDSTDAGAREAAARSIKRLLRDRGQRALDELESYVLPKLVREGRSDAARDLAAIVDEFGRADLRWWRVVPRSSMAVPHVVADGAYLACTGDGGLSVLTADGIRLWERPGRLAKPVPGIHSGVVYAYRPPNAIAAHRASDGETLWLHSFEDLGVSSARLSYVETAHGLERRPVPEPQLTDSALCASVDARSGRIFVTLDNGRLVALTLDGRRAWIREPAREGDGALLPAVLAPSAPIIVSGHWHKTKSLFALSAEDGVQIWSIAAPVWSAAPVIIGDSVLVSVAPTSDHGLEGAVWCVSLRDGRRIWSSPVPSPRESDGAEGTVVVTHPEGRTERGMITSPGIETVVEHMFACGERVIGETRDRRFCLQACDGRLIWSTPRGGGRFRGESRDGWLFGVSDGALIALDPCTGKVVRRIEMQRLDPHHAFPNVEVANGHEPPVASLGLLSAPALYGESNVWVAAESGCLLALRVPALQVRAESAEAGGH